MGNAKLTNAQTKRIDELRSKGVGYRLIAQELNLSRDAVRYYCKTHDLAGYAEDQMLENDNTDQCRQCGTSLPQNSSRQRRFCSDACRWKWWHEHGDEQVRPSATHQEVVCSNCGKTFMAYITRARKYCCHDCYIRDRFWRVEDGREPYTPPSKSHT